MEFTDFPPCKHRFGCVQCRNDSKFVEHMRKRFGEWKCPEGIPFGTPLEEMPEYIQTKIKTYQNKLTEKGRDLPQINNKDQIAPPSEKSKTKKHPMLDIDKKDRSKKTKIKSFTETYACQTRAACVECRNSEKFRKDMERRYGKWECPENIPIGTPIEEMPQKVVRMRQKRIEEKEKQQQYLNQLRSSLDDLEEILPTQALSKLDFLRFHIFPNDKHKNDMCIHNTKEKTKVDRKCCGGKTKKVDGFKCKIHGDTDPQYCSRCTDFRSKR